MFLAQDVANCASELISTSVGFKLSLVLIQKVMQIICHLMCLCGVVDHLFNTVTITKKIDMTVQQPQPTNQLKSSWISTKGLLKYVSFSSFCKMICRSSEQQIWLICTQNEVFAPRRLSITPASGILSGPLAVDLKLPSLSNPWVLSLVALAYASELVSPSSYSIWKVWTMALSSVLWEVMSTSQKDGTEFVHLHPKKAGFYSSCICGLNGECR